MSMKLRRLAGLVAIAIAGAATLATSQPAPTPAATIKQEIEGTVELTAATPAAVREFHLRLNGAGVGGGGSPTVIFLATSDHDEDVRLRIVPTTADTTPELGSTSNYRALAGVQGVSRTYRLACPTVDSCEGHFALIVEWDDPAATAEATIDWQLAADIGVWKGEAAGTAIVDFAEEALAVAEPAVAVEGATGDAIRLDAQHRLAQWRVSMRLGADTLEAAPAWPLVTSARLTPVATLVAGPDEGNEAHPIAFIDVPDDPGLGSYDMGPGPIEWDPFASCRPGEECRVESVMALKWGDSRFESAADAGIAVDVRAIGADGTELPVFVTVEPVPPLAFAVGHAEGTMVWTKGSRNQFQYLVSVPAPVDDNELYSGTRIPTYGILRATMTSTGSTPLPDDFAINFGRYGGERRISIADGEVVFAFTPDDSGGGCRVANAPCVIERGLAAGFDEDSIPDGAELTVTWELEIGVGTSDPDPAPLRIVDVTDATPQP